MKVLYGVMRLKPWRPVFLTEATFMDTQVMPIPKVKSYKSNTTTAHTS